jgi:hypothetical protein
MSVLSARIAAADVALHFPVYYQIVIDILEAGRE